ncbi:cupin [Paeniglutamicibacter sp. MACA_103]|uniref:cupin n=1 Tax=Paeniglutamicibacter sp. MACA_103 TaxID=3377337 RepID=UPI003894910D
MHVTSAELDQLIAREFEKASASTNGRSAVAVLNDGRLRHTLVTLLAGSSLNDHEKPEAATLQVLSGSIVVNWAGESRSIAHGGLFVLPAAIHNVVASEDSAFLLTSLAG